MEIKPQNDSKATLASKCDSWNDTLRHLQHKLQHYDDCDQIIH